MLGFDDLFLVSSTGKLVQKLIFTEVAIQNATKVGIGYEVTSAECIAHAFIPLPLDAPPILQRFAGRQRTP